MWAPRPWNGLWDDAQNNPSAASAVSAIACVIGAASACAACEHTSHKPPVVNLSLTRPGTAYTSVGLRPAPGLGTSAMIAAGDGLKGRERAGRRGSDV